jgi:hypothetical protein
MNALVFQVLAVLAAAGGPATSENTLLRELVEKGVQMPDGQVVCLPVPTMAEGLSAKQQTAVLAATATLGRTTLLQFTGTASNAPVTMKLTRIAAGNNGEDIIRKVNLYFVVYGDWDVLTSDEFSKSILKEGKANNQNNMVRKAGYLKAPDLAVRHLSARSTSDLKEFFLYTTLRLFHSSGERVELSTTRFGVATKTPAGVIIAARLDPRFAKDKEYPNQWRAIGRNAQGNIVLGPPQPCSGAAFYAKVTRLIQPKNAIFVEFHQVFYEPRAWFGEDDNLTPSELRKSVPFEVREFRIKLLLATQKQAKKKPGEEKPADK